MNNFVTKSLVGAGLIFFGAVFGSVLADPLMNTNPKPEAWHKTKVADCHPLTAPFDLQKEFTALNHGKKLSICIEVNAHFKKLLSEQAVFATQQPTAGLD